MGHHRDIRKEKAATQPPVVPLVGGRPFKWASFSWSLLPGFTKNRKVGTPTCGTTQNPQVHPPQIASQLVVSMD